MIEIIGYTQSKEEFEDFAKMGQTRFEELHKFFDIYHSYEGINNIKIINDNAGIRPVKVSREIVDIILFSKEWHDKTGGAVNIALGPVLSIWHDYRDEGKSDPEKARLPDLELLKIANMKTDINKVAVDVANNTVFLEEVGMKLDIGAVAKGYGTEIVATELKNAGFTSFAISSGGNVRVVGSPKDGVRTKWGIGIQDPDKNAVISESSSSLIIDTIYIEDASLVTSGDYQRYYEVNGKLVHHLIDPKTLMPANHYRAVTIMTENSALADFMSTTVFLFPYSDSRSLVESIEGLEAMWIMNDGSINATDNMKNMMKNLGG